MNLFASLESSASCWSRVLARVLVYVHAVSVSMILNITIAMGKVGPEYHGSKFSATSFGLTSHCQPWFWGISNQACNAARTAKLACMLSFTCCCLCEKQVDVNGKLKDEVAFKKAMRRQLESQMKMWNSTASNRYSLSEPLWFIFLPQRMCLHAWKCARTNDSPMNASEHIPTKHMTWRFLWFTNRRQDDLSTSQLGCFNGCCSFGTGRTDCMFVLTVQRCHEPTDLRKNNFLHLNFGQKMNYFLTCASEKNPDLLGPKIEKLIEKLGVEFDFKYCYEDTQDTIGQTVDQTGLFEFVVSKDKNSPAGPACPSVGVFAFLLALFLFILLLVGLLFP